MIFFGIGGLILVCWCIYKICKEVSKTDANRRLAEKRSKDITDLAARLTAVNVQNLRNSMRELKNRDHQTLGVLRAKNGEPINICPRCNSPIRTIQTPVAITVICRNHRCDFIRNLPQDNETILDLRVT